MKAAFITIKKIQQSEIHEASLESIQNDFHAEDVEKFSINAEVVQGDNIADSGQVVEKSALNAFN